MTSQENSDNERPSLLKRLGPKGIGAACLSLVFGADSASVFLAPLVHMAGGGDISDVREGFIIIAGVEAAIAIHAGAYAVKRARQQN